MADFESVANCYAVEYLAVADYYYYYLDFAFLAVFEALAAGRH